MNLIIIYVFFIINTVTIINGQLCMLLNATNGDELWEQYKQRHDKHYVGYMERRRKEIWFKNCEKVRKHNEEAQKGLHNFLLSSNRLADMSHRRYHARMIKLMRNRYRDSKPLEEVGSPLLATISENIPEEFDWREIGFTSLPYNQKDCGSCYAFSITHSVQAQVFRLTNISEPLSEQQIIDCSLTMGNHGCAGGSLRNTLKYLEASGGLMAARDYPYVARQTTCKFNKNKILVNITNWSILPPNNEEKMKQLVAKVGPLAASINASPQTFQLYKSGIYDDSSCSSNVVNHAILIIGYTKDAWILKNWWGKKWGEDGYMRLKRNNNQCGISNYVAAVFV